MEANSDDSPVSAPAVKIRSATTSVCNLSTPKANHRTSDRVSKAAEVTPAKPDKAVTSSAKVSKLTYNKIASNNSQAATTVTTKSSEATRIAMSGGIQTVRDCLGGVTIRYGNQVRHQSQAKRPMDSDGFILVGSGKPRDGGRRRRGIVGMANSEVNNLRAASFTQHYHIGHWAMSVTPEYLRSYVNSFARGVKITELNTHIANRKFRSFKASVDSIYHSDMLNPEHWPKGISVFRWYERTTGVDRQKPLPAVATVSSLDKLSKKGIRFDLTARVNSNNGGALAAQSDPAVSVAVVKQHVSASGCKVTDAPSSSASASTEATTQPAAAPAAAPATGAEHCSNDATTSVSVPSAITVSSAGPNISGPETMDQ